jgi:hypothetical protein
MVSFLSPVDLSTTDMDEIALIPKMPQADDVKENEYWSENVELFRRTLDEDYVLVQTIQSALHSGANEHQIFGRFEFAPARFHQQLEFILEREETRKKMKGLTASMARNPRS